MFKMKKLYIILIGMVLLSGLVFAGVRDLGNIFRPDIKLDLTPDEKTWATNTYDGTKPIYNYWEEGDKLKANVVIGNIKHLNVLISADYNIDKVRCDGDEKSVICIELSKDELCEEWITQAIKSGYINRVVTKPSQNKSVDWIK